MKRGQIEEREMRKRRKEVFKIKNEQQKKIKHKRRNNIRSFTTSLMRRTCRRGKKQNRKMKIKITDKLI